MNKRGRIGFDIDGTMTIMNEQMIEFGKEYIKGTGHTIINPNAEFPEDIFGFSQLEASEFCNHWYPIYNTNPKIRHWVSELLSILIKYYDIWIITARSLTQHLDVPGLSYHGETMRRDTENMLFKNSIPYTQIAYGVKDKYAFCKENDILIMVDDSAGNIKPFIENEMGVIGIMTKYNEDLQKIKSPHVTWFSEWGVPMLKEILYRVLPRFNEECNIGPCFDLDVHPSCRPCVVKRILTYEGIAL